MKNGSDLSEGTGLKFQSIKESVELNEKNIADMDKIMKELVKVIEEIGHATSNVAISAENLHQVATVS